jgi:transposase-like protein
MEDYPKTLLEFEKRFKSDEDCRDYLFQLRWPDGFICPRCQNQKAWPIGDTLYHCTQCGYKLSVIAGTIFQDTHKPLTLWFRMIWWLTSQKNGASALNLKKVLGLGSYRTAWTWLHKLRRAMVRPGRENLSGIVELDESYIGGEKPGKRGRGAFGKALIFIAVETSNNRIGRIRLQRISDASSISLEAAAQNCVSLGSVIRTDQWKGYSNFQSLGYVHELVRSSSDPGENLLPSCHRIASLLKRWLIGTHQGAVSHEHLDYYLDEFTFRFNRRTSTHRGKLFYRLLQNAVQIDPIPLSKIVKNVRKNKRFPPYYM